MMEQIYKEAISELLNNDMPVWQIPKYVFTDSRTDKDISIDVDDWQDYCTLDINNNLMCPIGFYETRVDDEDLYKADDMQIIFTAQQVKDKMLDICKTNYDSVYTEIINNKY